MIVFKGERKKVSTARLAEHLKERTYNSFLTKAAMIKDVFGQTPETRQSVFL
jgi:hypothetical protein